MKNLLLVFVLTLVACLNITPPEVEEYLEVLVDDGIVATVTCPSLLTVLEEGDCEAFNANVTKIVLEPPTWNSSADAIIQIDQNGHMVAKAVGVSIITAIGIKGSTASVVVTVQ